mgnify:CR=1 FL=1
MSERITERISIQVTLSGYSFAISGGGTPRKSGWLGADRIFTTPEFQGRYDSVEISLLTPKFTLVPSHFFEPSSARASLEDVVDLAEGDRVETVDIPWFDSVLVYSNSIGESLSRAISQTVTDTSGNHSSVLPEMYYILRALPSIGEYNKILASWHDSTLCLAIAQGRSLMLCNSYEAVDFTTAEYFIFLALKKLQMNPEVTSMCFRTPLTPEQEMSLYRYFKAVEVLEP